MRGLYEFIMDNSMAVSLMIGLGAVITIMMGSLEFTTMQQMFVIMATMYGLCRLYQRYEREFEPEYSLMGGKNLEKLFAVLTVFIMGVALYVDICTVMRL